GGRELEFVLFGDGAAHLFQEGIEIGLTAIDLLDDDQPLFPPDLDGESGATTEPQRVVAAFDRAFDVLRIVVETADDDQIFEPPRDKQVTVLQESQVAGSQKRPLEGVGDVGAESMIGLGGTAPVTLSDALARNPDLAHLIRRASAQRLRVDDDYASIEQAPAAS